MNWQLGPVEVNSFKAIFVPLCALLAVRAFVRTWTARVPRRAGLLSFAIWLAAAMLIAAAEFTIPLANKLGIKRGADLVIYVAILCGVSLSLYFYHRFRHLEILITGLVRREAVTNAVRGNAGEETAKDAD